MTHKNEIDVSNLYMSQKSAKRNEIIIDFLNRFKNGESITSPIYIEKYKSCLVIKNGHHRCVAAYLLGRPLEEGEYFIIEKDEPIKKFQKISTYVESRVKKCKI